MNGLKNNLTKPLMYYFVYKITNCINNHYYIGVHQTKDVQKKIK